MSEIVIYEDGEVHLELSLEKETFWLDSNDIADIFDVKRPAVVKHIGNIYKSDELDKEATCSIVKQVAKDENMVCAKFAHTTQHGAIEGNCKYKK